MFDQTPQFARTQMSGKVPAGGLQDARVLYVIAAALAGFTLILIFVLRKG
jgi:hypothetical protein